MAHLKHLCRALPKLTQNNVLTVNGRINIISELSHPPSQNVLRQNFGTCLSRIASVIGRANIHSRSHPQSHHVILRQNFGSCLSRIASASMCRRLTSTLMNIHCCGYHSAYYSSLTSSDCCFKETEVSKKDYDYGFSVPKKNCDERLYSSHHSVIPLQRLSSPCSHDTVELLHPTNSTAMSASHPFSALIGSKRHFHTSCVNSVAAKEEKEVSRKRQPQDGDIELLLENSQDTIQQYASVLGCSEEAVEEMVRYDPRLVSPNRKEDVIAKMRLLLGAGFTTRDILGRCQVFTRSLEHLQLRLAAMQPVKHYRYRIAHVFLTADQFRSRMADYRKEAAVMGDHPNQASFVAQILECSEKKVVSMSKYTMGDFLLTYPPSRLQEAVSVLQSFGVTREMMRDKFLMLRIQPSVIRDRLQRMVDAGVFDLQRVPSALYNNDATFSACFQTWVRNAEALSGYATERHLLMTRLQCSEADISDLFHRKPNVARLSSGKLKSCLDILQGEIGVSAGSILLYGDLLHFRPQRLRNRWALLRELELPEHALVKDLLLTEQQFTAKYGFDSK